MKCVRVNFNGASGKDLRHRILTLATKALDDSQSFSSSDELFCSILFRGSSNEIFTFSLTPPMALALYLGYRHFNYHLAPSIALSKLYSNSLLVVSLSYHSDYTSDTSFRS